MQVKIYYPFSSFYNCLAKFMHFSRGTKFGVILKYERWVQAQAVGSVAYV